MKRKIKTKDFDKKMSFLILILSLLFLLSACDSIDKDDADFLLKDTQFEYHEETNITTVTCNVNIFNGTIYNISSFAVDFGVFSNGERIETEPFQYNHRVKHGSLESVGITFTVEGKIDQVIYSSWTPQFESVWKTYINVFIAVIAAIIILVIGRIAYWIYDEFF